MAVAISTDAEFGDLPAGVSLSELSEIVSASLSPAPRHQRDCRLRSDFLSLRFDFGRKLRGTAFSAPMHSFRRIICFPFSTRLLNTLIARIPPLASLTGPQTLSSAHCFLARLLAGETRTAHRHRQSLPSPTVERSCRIGRRRCAGDCRRDPGTASPDCQLRCRHHSSSVTENGLKGRSGERGIESAEFRSLGEAMSSLLGISSKYVFRSLSGVFAIVDTDHIEGGTNRLFLFPIGYTYRIQDVRHSILPRADHAIARSRNHGEWNRFPEPGGVHDLFGGLHQSFAGNRRDASARTFQEDSRFDSYSEYLDFQGRTNGIGNRTRCFSRCV